MNDTTQTLIRSVLKIGAGYLAAKGLASDSQAQELVAAITGILAILWGIAHRTPSTNSGQPTIKTPIYAAALLSCLLLGSGCVSQAIKQGDTVTISERMFGIWVAQSVQNQSPEVKLGFGSSVVQITPTSTNGPIYAPKYATTFSIQQSAVPFATGIDETVASGDTATYDATNVTSSAIVPK